LCIESIPGGMAELRSRLAIGCSYCKFIRYPISGTRVLLPLTRFPVGEIMMTSTPMPRPDDSDVPFMSRIGTRLGLAFVLVFVMLSAAGALAIHRMNELAGLTEKMYRHPFAVTNASRAMDAEFLRKYRDLREFSTNMMRAVTPTEFDDGIKAMKARDAVLAAEMAIVKERFLGPKAMVADVEQALSAWNQFSERVIALKREDKDTEANALVQAEGETRLAAMVKPLHALRDWAMAKGKALNEDAIKARDEALRDSIATALLALIIAGVAAWRVTRSITAPLGSAVAAVRQVASGDLTVPIQVKGNDECARLLGSVNDMQVKLREVAGGIRGGADRLAETAAEFAAASQQVSNSADAQSEAAVSTSAAVEQLTVSIAHVSDNARNAEAVTRDANDLSRDGAEVVGKAIAEMSHIADAVQTSSTGIANLERQSEKISGITGVIREIADQTNLLALNAAIEAARAGEQGRGFAVVADEVRKLAERTAASTAEISTMLDKMVADGREAARAMEASVQMVNTGSTLAGQAGVAIERITAGNARVVAEVNDITGAVAEQRSASESIARNVERIAQMIEENSAAARQSAASAQGLRSVADELRGQASWFKT